MNRRDFLRGLLSGVGAAALLGLDGAVGLARAAQMTVVYVSAADCIYCRRWESYDRASFQAKIARQGVRWREVNVSSYRNIREEAMWPADLRWVLSAIPNKGGTPRWIVLDGKSIVQNEQGIGNFNNRINSRFG